MHGQQWEQRETGWARAKFRTDRVALLPYCSVLVCVAAKSHSGVT